VVEFHDNREGACMSNPGEENYDREQAIIDQLREKGTKISLALALEIERGRARREAKHEPESGPEV
jgi:hypothetical protein